MNSAEVELVGEPKVCQNGDVVQEFKYRDVVFKFIERSDPEKPNEVWSQNLELHPAFWFYCWQSNKKLPQEIAMISGAETILSKHKEWAKRATP